MVAAHHQLLSEGTRRKPSALDPRHVDGLHAFLCVGRNFILISWMLFMPLACQPVQIAGTQTAFAQDGDDAIRNDPEWKEENTRLSRSKVCARLSICC